MELNYINKILIENMSDAVYVRDLDQKIVYMNPASEKLTGWPRQKAVGKKCHQVFKIDNRLCPGDCSFVKTTPGDGHEPEQVVPRQVQVETPSGKIKKMEISIWPLYEGEEGPSTGAVVLIKDIDGLKETKPGRAGSAPPLKKEVGQCESADEAIHREREGLASIFDNIDEVIYIADPDTYELIYVNASARAIFGEAIAGKKCYKVFQDLDAPCDFCTNPIIFGENIGEPYIWEFQNKVNGRWYRCIDRAIEWPDHRMVRYEMAVDIHDRKMTEEALRDSEERYRNLVESSPIPILVHSEEKFVFANPEAVKVLGGKSPEDFIGKSVLDLVHPDYHASAKTRIKQIYEAHKTAALMETRFIRLDGKIIDIEGTGTPINFKGKPASQFVFYEITGRKRAENINSALYTISKAVNSTQNLKGFYRSIHQSLEKIIDTSNFFVALYDKEKNEIVFPYFVDQKDDYSEPLQMSDSGSLTVKVIRSGKPLLIKRKQIEKRYYKETGEKFGTPPEIWLGVPLKIKSEVIGIIAVQSYTIPDLYSENDVALLESVSEQIATAIERKRAEAELLQSENLYNSTVNSIGAYIHVLDKDLKFLLVNDAFKRFVEEFDLQTEIVGKSLEEILPFIGKKELEEYRNVFENGKELTKEQTVKIKNHQFMAETRKIPVFEGDQVVRVITMTTDITERKQAEKDRKRLESRLRQSQKMEAIGTLAGGIAHDFNNILGTIFCCTELAMDTIPEESEATQDLKQVLESAHRARDLVQQILSFSRKTEPSKEPLSVAHVAEEALKLLRSSLPTTIEIKKQINRNTGLVLANQAQIQQIIMNLCVNAGQAMKDKGGILEVSLNNINLDSYSAARLNLARGPYLELRISDTGCGMSEEVHKRIFDPYFTTKKSGEGTGLGLTVVHSAVENHNGVITVYSEEGEGTTFHVYLPQYEGEKKEEAHDPPPQPGRNEHILFVDDEASLVSAVPHMLEKLGYRVTALTSSTQALETFRSTPDAFDLVITDRTMPHMTGFELAAKIKQINPKMPVILSSGFSNGPTDKKITDIGINKVVMKPLIRNDLARTLREVLDPQEKK